MSESEQICGCDKPDCYFCWLRNRTYTTTAHVEIMPTDSDCGITLCDILEKVSYASGVSIDDIKGRKRNSEICVARHLYCHFAKKIGKWKDKQIAKMIGRDRTTVIHSYRIAQQYIDSKDNLTLIVYEKAKKELITYL